MKKYKVIWMSIANLSMAFTLTACKAEVEERAERPTPPATEILADKAVKAPPSGLVRLQERPLFPMDENKFSIAMLEDSGEKPRPSDKPVAIAESKPQ